MVLIPRLAAQHGALALGGIPGIPLKYQIDIYIYMIYILYIYILYDIYIYILYNDFLGSTPPKYCINPRLTLSLLLSGHITLNLSH